MKYLLLVLGLLTSIASADQIVWVEAEQFAETGRWSNDSQYVDLMGSPYLLATGVGKPVDDAVTRVQVPAAGEYRLWVRCKDWLPSHSPGRFQVVVGGRVSKVVFGKAKTDAWQWVDGGPFDLKAGETEIRLHDTTGWWARCDAVVLAPSSFRPSNETEELAAQRYKFGGVSAEVERPADFDVVVVGGGPAGLGASIAAARHGCRVALVQDRPVLGGNSSSEIQVPPMGYIGNPPDKVNITGLAEELFPTQGWHNFADSKKIERIVRAEKNISLMLNTRATGVEMAADDRIAAVLAMNVHTGRRMALSAPLFIDCTGHGWIGYYAGADYRMGQEARGEFGESLAPVEAGNRTMGNSLYNAGFETRQTPVPFECPDWAYQWKKSEDFEPLGSHRRLRTIERPDNFDVPSRGKGRNPGNDLNGAIVYAWWVEYGGMLSTIDDAEQIRDELFRISIGLWNYAKNHNPGTVGRNANRELVWLNYVPGVRESRRLMGDYIMSQQDFDRQIEHPDIVAFTDWGPDMHHPEGFWVQGNDCIHVYQGRRTGIPYRTLYSRNIGNLLIAGRCHSATHVALGGTRVMRPMSMTGQAAGTAAALALRHKTNPRGVYESHIRPLQQALLKDGCYLPGVKNEDPDDLARQARVTASSWAETMGPQNVVNGFSRVVGKDRGAWAPVADRDGPHWLQFQLPEAAEIDTVHVTFEDRPAAVQVQVALDGRWTTAPTGPVTMRRNRLRFPSIRTDKVRLLFTDATNRPAVCEVRIYGDR